MFEYRVSVHEKTRLVVNTFGSYDGAMRWAREQSDKSWVHLVRIEERTIGPWHELILDSLSS